MSYSFIFKIFQKSILGFLIILLMSFEDFFSGKLNKQNSDKPIQISTNIFQQILLLFNSTILSYQQNNRYESSKLNKYLNDNSKYNESNIIINQNNQFQNDQNHQNCFRLIQKIQKWIKLNIKTQQDQILIGFLDFSANLLGCFSLKQTYLTFFSMICNSICISNLIVSLIFLNRRFNFYNTLGCIVCFISTIVLIVQSNDQNIIKFDYNIWIGNFAAFMMVIIYSTIDVNIEHVQRCDKFNLQDQSKQMSISAILMILIVSLFDNQLMNLFYLLHIPEFRIQYLIDVCLNACNYYFVALFIDNTSACMFGILLVLKNVSTSIIDKILNDFESDLIQQGIQWFIISGAIIFNYGEYNLQSESNDKEIKQCQLNVENSQLKY